MHSLAAGFVVTAASSAAVFWVPLLLLELLNPAQTACAASPAATPGGLRALLLPAKHLGDCSVQAAQQVS